MDEKRIKDIIMEAYGKIARQKVCGCSPNTEEFAKSIDYYSVSLKS